MLRSITIAGLGPYGAPTRISLDPAGRTDIAQPSASGKTTLVTALCWALWNTTPTGQKLGDEWIHGDADECSVTVETAKGTTFTRAKRRNASPRREKNGEPVGTERDWFGALGPLGKDADLLRTIVCPLVWVDLANGPGGGRPLRDLLATLLPSSDLRGVVRELCPDLRDSDSISEQDAFSRRTEANRQRDTARGRVQALEAQEVPAGNRIEQPTPEEAARAQAVLTAARAWEAWRPVAAWLERVAALGPKPEADDKLAKKLAALEAAEAKHTDAQSEVARLESLPTTPGPTETLREMNAAADRLRKLEAAGGKCPECGQSRPDHLTAMTAARQDAEATKRAHEAAHKMFEAAQKREREQTRIALDTARGNRDAAKLAMAKARTQYEAALRSDAGNAWEAARKALGEQPDGPERAPVEPPATEAEVAAAHEVLRRLQEAAGARREAEAARTRLARDLSAARADAERWTAEADRLDRLVEAIRRAPSVVAERQLGALGAVRDGRAVVGPVSIGFPAQGPAVEVLIDGRPYWTASRGRQVVADLALRMALRRARKLAWLPIFVDNAQDWSGALETEGPAVVLRTAAGAARAAVEAA